MLIFIVISKSVSVIMWNGLLKNVLKLKLVLIVIKNSLRSNFLNGFRLFFSLC